MKIFMTALTLAALATSSAYAHRAPDAARQVPAASAYAAYPNQANSINGGRLSSDVVVSPDNRIAGQDPDPNVRLQLLREYGSWNQ